MNRVNYRQTLKDTKTLMESKSFIRIRRDWYILGDNLVRHFQTINEGDEKWECLIKMTTNSRVIVRNDIEIKDLSQMLINVGLNPTPGKFIKATQ